ncbi:hypothetical protein DC363_16260 [Thalassorhabdomicrobium marinisediminis]|uniref:Uncharacterized protein n=1 Tax=Thalassorhabdomicrobium marinisediminis TaxID=2170577 RepID=A0A2T7FSV2_9RHOB|nr:hypothetical protein DC363_16260 [Thalassorhabdomicrobium marinisediminis]
MTKPLDQHAPLDLPEPSKVIFDQLLQTHKKVEGLYPLIDLLTRPDDQREALGERLASLLRELIETQQTYQAQHAEMTKAFTELSRQTETLTNTMQDRLVRQEKKMSQLMKMLGHPID